MKNRIVWFTGHSRVGKTTLVDMIKSEIDCIVLDGDEMRESISLCVGFSVEDRKQHNLKIARLAKILSKQKNVIVSAICPIRSVREEISKICGPIWINIKRNVSMKKK